MSEDAHQNADTYQPNQAQRDAIEAIDGPLLVMAGPGTGKTELLSRRAAHILDARDVAPENVLCLTFTDVGAATMRTRLIQRVGRDAYGIGVYTFHAFTSELRQRWPEYFVRPTTDHLVTELESARALEAILDALPSDDPLHRRVSDVSAVPEGQGGDDTLENVRSFISKFRQSGLTVGQFHDLTDQTAATLDHISEALESGELAFPSLRGTPDKKQAAIDGFVSGLGAVLAALPPELSRPVVKTPGVCVPYARMLRDAFSGAGVDDDGKTTSFGKLRDRFFDTRRLAMHDSAACERGRSAIGVYERYRAWLDARHLYDFDDMIVDAIAAAEGSPVFRSELARRYRYVQVDEFQDTNGAQMRLVELVVEGQGKAPNLMVVGDDDQGIMRFQGSSVCYISQFESRFDARRITLTENYRSLPALVGLGQHVVRQIETRSDAGKRLIAHRPAAIEPCGFPVRSYPTKDIEYHELARDIAGYVDSHKGHDGSLDPKAVVVIARAHKTLRALIPHLNSFGVPFAYAMREDLEGMDELATPLATLRFVAMRAQGRLDRADRYLPEIVCAPEYGLADVDCVGLAVRARRLSCKCRRDPARSGWLEALGEDTHPRVKALAARLRKLAVRAASAPVREVVYEAAAPTLDYSGARRDEDPLALAELGYGLRALVEFAEGETAAAGVTEDPPRRLRLADVVSRLDEARHLGVEVRVEVPLTRPGAVTLTTAHGAKGDEFSRVYVADADDRSWRVRGGTTPYLTRNMLFSNQEDEDDVRRLLFVALTRAKDELALYKGAGELVPELAGAPGLLMEEPLAEASPTQAALAVAEESAVTWRDRYRVEGPDAFEIVRPDVARMKMSASRLNRFVTYSPGCANTTGFETTDVLELPQAPNQHMEFGTLVHEFLESHLTERLRPQGEDPEVLAAAFRGRVVALDYEDATVEDLARRFDDVARRFVPWLDGHIPANGSCRLWPERWVSAEVDGVPLVGKCDLVVCDEDAKAIVAYDYKTGRPKTKEDGKDAGYQRQLRFYRLLIESSAEFCGYHVAGVANLYVEPGRVVDERGKVGYELAEPVSYAASDEDVGHVRALVRAAWHRIQSGAFDTSAFEDSEGYHALVESSVTREGRPKKPDKAKLQALYEQWLIEQDDREVVKG